MLFPLAVDMMATNLKTDLCVYLPLSKAPCWSPIQQHLSHIHQSLVVKLITINNKLIILYTTHYRSAKTVAINNFCLSDSRGQTVKETDCTLLADVVYAEKVSLFRTPASSKQYD